MLGFIVARPALTDETRESPGPEDTKRLARTLEGLLEARTYVSPIRRMYVCTCMVVQEGGVRFENVA